MATINDVAHEAGVSVGSVSRYLNGYHLKKENEDKVQTAIEKLQYYQNQMAKSLKTSKSFSIGVVLDTTKNNYSAQLVAKLEEKFDEYNYVLILTSHRNQEKDFTAKVNNLLERAVDALIVVKPHADWPSFQKLGRLKIPVLSVEVPSPDNNVNSVCSADKQAAYQVVSKLLTKSSQLGVIMPESMDYVQSQRKLGITKALNDAGVRLKTDNFLQVEYSTQQAYDKAEILLKNGVRAIFVTSYHNTLLVMRAIKDHNLKIGKDIFLGCFGYNDIFEGTSAPLTLIRQPIDEIADRVSSLLLAKLHEIKLYPEINKKDIIVSNQICEVK